MMNVRRLRGCLPLLLLAALAGAWPGSTAKAEARDPQNSFSFRLETPSLEIKPDDSGFVSVEAAGLNSRHSALGAPDLPTRTILVAIPADAVPRLEVKRTGRSRFHAVRPLPRVKPTRDPALLPAAPGVPAREFAASPAPVYRPDPQFYDTDASYPRQAAWLGEIGVLRDQRYVEVHIAPIRFDGERGGLVVDARIEVSVTFAGTPSEFQQTESRFEAVYRQAFVNYAQGRRFRLGDRRATTAASTSGVVEGPIRRIRVRENGLLRLDYDAFLAQAPEFLAEPTSNWRLTSQGVQVPLQIHQIPAGGFDDTLLDHSGEFVQFYGQALDLEPKTVFISDDAGLGDLLFEAGDFSDENVYFLSVAASAQPSILERDAAPGGEPLAGDFFYDTRHVETDDFFFPYSEFDLWYSLPFLTEAAPLRVDGVDLPGLHSGTLPATFRVNLRGTSECRVVIPDKQTMVFVINDLAEQLVLPADDPNNNGNVNVGIFDGNDGFIHDFEWNHAGGEPELTDPLNVAMQIFNHTEPCGDPPGPIRDEAIVDWIEVEYARSFEAVGNTLTFSWPDGPDRVFEIDGVTAAVEVYEITGFLGDTDVANAVRLTGVEVVPDGPDFTARFRVDNDPGLTDETLRRFVVTGESAIFEPAPADFEADRVSDVAADTTHADLVVIVHPDVVDSECTETAGPCSTDNDCPGSATDFCRLDPSSDLSQLLMVRAQQGIDSRVVRMPDLMDEFNHGLAGPKAIKNFITWLVAGGWQGDPPAFAMLVGDGSYDYKGGTAEGNYVPTQMVVKTDDVIAYYASDNLLATVVGEDFLPELLIGRISARTTAEADLVFQKLLAYDLSPPGGTWRSNVLLMSDRANDNGDFEAEQFESMNDDAIDWLEGSVYTNQNLRYWTDYCGGGPSCNQAAEDAMRDDIKAAINGVLDETADGAVMAQFNGHGAFDFWSSDVLICGDETNIHCSQDDTLDFMNGARLPWLIVHNCLSGGFHPTDPKTLGEQWLKRENGGAIAVFAPSGLGFRFIGRTVIEEIWGTVFGPPKQRDLVAPVLSSLVRLCVEQPSPEACQYHVLLGDPSMRLALPHVEPPTEVEAAARSGEVALSWTASATAGSTYEIFRARFAGGNVVGNGTCPSLYCSMGMSATTDFTDSTVQNAGGYVYYVVALDPDGFDSAWSNFNTDCAEDPPGEDCVLALPLNDTPPDKPTGGHATDQETGGTVIVEWDENAENDLAYYTVHYGETPALGQSTNKAAHFDPTLTVSGLSNGTLHYFAVTATNTSGLTSVLSDLFTETPTLVLGVKAPDPVVDLLLSKSGTSALLTWGDVTTDIYGGTASIDHYEVFRGESAQFIPAPGNRVGTPPTTEFMDAGVVDFGEPDYFYLVRAIDGDGNPGGAGGQLPAGIKDLTLAASPTPGRLILSWSAVSTDFDDQPTVISHYELYASDQPFGRAEIQAGQAELLDASIAGTTLELLPEAQNRYYSVLAVDPRGNRSPF
jgi:hypothetical protein